MKLQSTNPEDAPLIDPSMFAHEENLAEPVQVVLISVNICHQPALFLGDEITPGASVKDIAGLKSFPRENDILCFHPVGTCRMGDPTRVSDVSTLVVDTALGVRGIAALRVADTSVIHLRSLLATPTNQL